MGMTTVLNVSGIDKNEFLAYTEQKPATYEDWSRTWNQVSVVQSVSQICASKVN